MKTAMQLLITHLEMLGDKVEMVNVQSIIDTINESYLLKEKEQIKTTYNIAVSDLLDNIEKTSEDYYNQKFNTKYEKTNTIHKT